jgi:hypothetical protein
MNKLALSLFLCTALAFTGCSSSGSGSGNVIDPPPVQAATYSTASITGTYGVNFFAANAKNVYTSIGTMVADGAGKITAGALTEYAGGTPCTVSFTGTYTLTSDASGTASLITTPSGTAGCAAPTTGTLTLALQAGQQGQTLLFNESDGVALATGTAVRQ